MMKRKITILTIFALFIGAIIGLTVLSRSTSVAFAEDYTDETLVGDVDGDGKISINDAYLILVVYAQRSVGIETNVDETLYDVDGDGVVSMTDAYLTLEAYATWSAGGGYEWPPLGDKLETLVSPTADSYMEDEYPTGSTVQYVGPYKWNLRSTDLTADISDTIVGTIECGDTFIIKGTYQPCWMEVYFQDDAENVYWIYASTAKYFNVYDENTATTTTEDVATYYNMGDIVKFSGTNWNLRTSMSTETSDNIAGKLLNGQEFIVLYHVDDSTWYQVVYDTGLYYVSLERDDLFTKTGEITTSEAGYYGLGDIVRFTGTSWNLRTSMSTETSDNIAGKVLNNEEFTILYHVNGTWYEVLYKDSVYYVSLERDELFTLVGAIA